MKAIGPFICKMNDQLLWLQLTQTDAGDWMVSTTAVTDEPLEDLTRLAAQSVSFPLSEPLAIYDPQEQKDFVLWVNDVN